MVSGSPRRLPDDLLAAGADVLTSGNHIWDKAEIAPYIANQPRLLPGNMGAGTSSGRVVIEGAGGLRLGVINIQTNLFWRKMIMPFKS